MQIIIKGKQMEITPRLRQIIERKVQRLSRLVDGETRVEVTVAEEQTRSARDRYSVQLAISHGSHPIHSEVSGVNASMALDLVLENAEYEDVPLTAQEEEPPVGTVEAQAVPGEMKEPSAEESASKAEGESA